MIPFSQRVQASELKVTVAWLKRTLSTMYLTNDDQLISFPSYHFYIKFAD